jgi:hypothetical protein
MAHDIIWLLSMGSIALICMLISNSFRDAKQPKKMSSRPSRAAFDPHDHWRGGSFNQPSMRRFDPFEIPEVRPSSTASMLTHLVQNELEAEVVRMEADPSYPRLTRERVETIRYDVIRRYYTNTTRTTQ